MPKIELKNGMLVRISGYEYKRPAEDGGYDYFVNVYDRNGNECTLRINNDERIYQIDETSVMPISYFPCQGNAVFYPLKDIHRQHSAKFFIDGRYLTQVESEYPEDEDEEPEDKPTDNKNQPEDKKVDPAPNGEFEWSEVKEFAKISQRISTITNALEDVIESLTKILKGRMN